MVALGAECDLLRPLVAGRPFLEAEVAVGGPSRARPVARRRAGSPDAAGPGAAGPRRGDRAARRRRSWPATSTGERLASRLEVDTYLAGARREFSVAPAGEAGPPDGAVDDRRTDATVVIGPSRGGVMVRGMDPDELQRAFFDAIYTYRIPLGIAAGVFAVGAALVAWRLGWFGAARRHPRTGGDPPRRRAGDRPAAGLLRRVAALDPDRAHRARPRRDRRIRPRC